MLKVLFAGLGSIGQRHLRNLRLLFGQDIVIDAYRTRNLQRVITEDLKIDTNSTVEEKYNLNQIFYDLNEALKNQYDAVFVCNPTSLHIPLSIKIARRGFNIFIEKPLSNNLNQISELRDLVKNNNLKVMIGYQMRFHPGLKKLKEIIDSGILGRLIVVSVECGEYLPDWHLYEDYRETYAARDDLGGGSVLSQIHEIDYLYWIFGLPKKIFSIGGKDSNLDINVDDNASSLMEFKYEGESFPVFLHTDFLQKPPVRKCKITGETGRAELDLIKNCMELIHTYGNEKKSCVYDEFHRNDMFADELKHFFYCIENDKKPLTDLEEGINSLKIAMYIKESMNSGSTIEL